MTSGNGKIDPFVLPVHEMANVFPVLSDGQGKGGESTNDRSALSLSIAANGVLHPIVTWRDEANTLWLIDGRNRREIVKELRESGVNVSLPVFELKGTEAEASVYVREANMQRRCLTPGQKAAIAVKSGELTKRYAAKGGKNKKEEEPGRTVEKISQHYGISVGYVNYADALFRKAPDLLEDVIAGRLSLPQAVAKLHERENPPKEEPAGAEPEEKAPTKKTVYDGLKNAVSEEFWSIFETRPAFKDIIKDLKSCESRIDKLFDTPGAMYLASKEVLSGVKNSLRLLTDAMPHAICPYCDGTGKNKESNGECEMCKGSRYLDKLRWKTVPEELKKAMTSEDDIPDGV